MRHVGSSATIKALSASCALAAVVCAPAFAASTIDISCDDTAEHSDAVSESEMRANPASHAESLAPRVEALIQEAFADDADQSPAEAEDTVEEMAIRDVAETELPVTLPGIPKDDIQRYKRRMYRTDI